MALVGHYSAASINLINVGGARCVYEQESHIKQFVNYSRLYLYFQRLEVYFGPTDSLLKLQLVS